MVAITRMEQACFSGTQIAQSASWQNANVSTVLKNGQIILSPPFKGEFPQYSRDSCQKEQAFLKGDMMKTELKIYGRILVAVLAVGLLVVIYHWAADKFRAPPVIDTTQQAAQTVQGVQQAAQQVKIPMGQAQAATIAHAVQQSVGKQPDQVVPSTGSEWEKTAERIRKKSGADFTMVTDPRRPNEKPAVKKDEPVNLNVYNIKAFPNHFEQIGYGLPSTIMVSANWKIAKTKTKEWYLGAWGMMDLKRPEQSRIGIMLTRM